jgi:hypothetical protein
MEEKEAEKQEAIRIVAEYNRMMDLQDKKRADEWAAREARIRTPWAGWQTPCSRSPTKLRRSWNAEQWPMHLKEIGKPQKLNE